MNEIVQPSAYGTLPEPATLRLERLLPGPIERVWAYLVEGEKRRKWLAGGEMEQRLGGAFEFVWRNDELTDPPGQRPDGFGAEHRMQGTITEFDPPHRLAISWGSTGGVLFTLEPRGTRVLLTLVHRRVTDPTVLLNVSAGWHAHLDVLAARLEGEEPAPFWDGWARLKADYRERLAR